MDPLFQWLANNYGLATALLLVAVVALWRALFPWFRDHFIPYLEKLRQERQAREDRVLQAFESSIQTAADTSHAVQSLARSHDEMRQVMQQMSVTLQVYAPKKRNPPMSGD